MDIAKIELSLGKISCQLGDYAAKTLFRVTETKQFFDERYAKMSSVLEKVRCYLHETLVKETSRIASSHEYCELRKVYRKWDENWENNNGFNLFLDLTRGNDLNEVNHIRVLAKFLDPNTPWPEDSAILADAFLKCFVDILKKRSKECNKEIDFCESFTDKALVQWEDGPGLNDLLIHDQDAREIDFYIEENNRFVIIENKITGRAGDRPKQLGRYFNSVKKAGKEVVAIVYLPLFYKEPPK